MKKVSITFCVGKYDSASAKKDCTAETLIKTEAECEKAARHLGYGFQWGFSIPTNENQNTYPSKCGWDVAGIARFNKASGNSGPTSLVAATRGGICAKKGIN